jgi:hypothetical protein
MVEAQSIVVEELVPNPGSGEEEVPKKKTRSFLQPI